MNKYWSVAKKSLLISSIIEFLVAWTLVKLFGNHYEGESIVGDVFLVILIFWGIQLFFGLKDLLSWYLIYRFCKKDFIDEEVQFLIKNKFPNPNHAWDIDNPDIYYQDVMNNEELPIPTRIIASQKYANLIKNEHFGSVIKSVILSNANKESLIAYKNYCDKNEI